MKNILVVGAGPSGLACAKRLSENGFDVTVIDKRGYKGGLCSSFNIDGFNFDRFVHFSFTQDKEVISLFNKSCKGKVREFKPSVYNYFKSKYIMHPVQNNLNSLGVAKGLLYLTSYITRKRSNIVNYYDWLCASYGKKFADDFPVLYTQKYWCADPKNMETKWIGPRMSNISFIDYIQSIFSKNERVKYYHKTQRYPEFGGYGSFLNELDGCYKLELDTELIYIDVTNKVAKTTQKDIKFDSIVYTAPLKEFHKFINEDTLKSKCDQLHHTSGYMVSLGLNKKPNNKGIFFYIYDKDILFARAYYPHLKSTNNVPDGCYSMQLEFYTLDGKEIEAPQDTLQSSINKVLQSIDLSNENMLFCDIKFEKYANVLFDHGIYKAREEIINVAKNNNIYLAGRFGLWDYLWSDQSIKSGFDAALQIINKRDYDKNCFNNRS
ncbi:Protoporphyrinogen oxidase [Anaerobiospirillum thomasii]|uniref:protoporphyrinogen/coproporphyrinogen oxidase n=1 Tax=Anaerobiospirillum thomasii TaxID=179995 RepID=UPI000D8FA7AD|nr:NAD(P)-binding protein [Anaerobiospirillum thomasii]SPT68352.1 Protoporphyrinogen oxidase [Anaerobiospirillum thomasii]